jgi:CheY-like chemotaxis protein
LSEPTALRILIVEDNQDSALSLKMLLEVLGHIVDVVHDGEEAIVAAAAQRPDVILMDIGLPGLSGYDAARRIRTDCKGSPILIIALTGWGQDQDRRRSADAGIDHHLVKPLDLDKLRRILASAPPPGAG